MAGAAEGGGDQVDGGEHGAVFTGVEGDEVAGGEGCAGGAFGEIGRRPCV